MIELASYDLTDRGRFTENLEILSAMKTYQVRFLRRIVQLHPDEVKLGDGLRCGSWIFFRHYHELGERSFAGGFTCKNPPLCVPCAFRRVYVAARACTDLILQQMKRNRNLVPLVTTLHLADGEDLSERFTHLKRSYRWMLRNRPHAFPSISGSIGCFHFSRGMSGWSLSCKEIMLVNAGHSEPLDVSALFPAVFSVFLGSVLNFDGALSHDEHFQAAQLIKGSQFCVPYGCLSGFTSPKQDSSDPQEERFAGQPFQEEQYRWDGELHEYVLEKVNTGSDMQFPLADYSKPGHVGGGRRARLAAARHSRFHSHDSCF